MSEAGGVERRRGGRRATDHPPAPSAPRAEESWFGALGVDADTEFQSDSTISKPVPLGHTRAGPLRSREARRIAAADDSAQRRVLRTYVAARAALGLVLAAVPWAGSVLGSAGGLAPPLAQVLVCLAYAAQALALWLLPRFQGEGDEAPTGPGNRLRWLGTIGVDLAAFGVLHLLDNGASLNFGALLVLPVLMSGVLVRRSTALAIASGVTLLLLGTGLWRVSQGEGGVVLIAQAGLAGIGLFVIALLAGELAGRLAREEMAARGSLQLARQQAQLNRLVIDEMTEGVLVVDSRARVRAANPAARVLLAEDREPVAPAPFQLQQDAAWAPLLLAVERAFGAGRWPDDAREIALAHGGPARTLQVRARFTRRRAAELGESDPTEEDICVLFLEDLRAVQARVRQEKLAAMGRVSAGIAHEIRNPLAAVAQANALMMEDEMSPGHQRLTRIVADNVERLKRIVDDVMEVAPGGAPAPQRIDLVAEVGAACSEWARTVGLPLGAASRLQVLLPPQAIGVLFDPEHLRRVLVNLLDNAHRHAGPEPGAIELHVLPLEETQVLMVVASDGAPIPPEVERHLFEPFFSTRSRGTGLGLYICRELCERYGAGIDYRPGPGGARHRNEFRVMMPRIVLPAAAPRLQI